MKSFAPKPWFAPQPVLIIGTYKWSCQRNERCLGRTVGHEGDYDLDGKSRHHRQPEAWRRVYRCLRYQENHGGF